MGLTSRLAKLFASTNLPVDVRRQRSRQRHLKVEQLEDRRLLATVDLATFTASQGSIITGEAAGDYSGFTVSDAGDVNGDGFDDVIIGAYGVNRGYADLAGKSYVVFGSATPASSIDLSQLGQPGKPNGMVVLGDAQDFFFGTVSSAGDVNGDGFDDLIIGSHFTEKPNNGNPLFRAGKSYLLFGGNSLPSSIDIANFNQPNGPTGVAINGSSEYDYSGRSVSSAGDINGDGLADIVVSSYGADVPGKRDAGKSFVIFGSRTLPANIELGTLGQSGQPAGITINGAVINDKLGQSVSGAGDVNGDGFQDIILGAALADPVNKTSAGKSYIIFGSDSLATTIDLATLGLPTGAAGVTINGETGGDFSGRAVSDAGDINGDGYDDVIIGALFASISGRLNAGKSYVVFGAASLPATIELSTLGQTGRPLGITLTGEASSNYSGTSVSGAGDVNGDGFADFLVGALGAEPIGKPSAGKTYLIFGATTLPIAMDLALAGQVGQPAAVVISGAVEDDRTGVSVSRAGDVNGDGFDDVVFGAHLADPLALNSAGTTYILFGNNQFTNSIAPAALGTAIDDLLLGGSIGEPMNGGGGKDLLFSNGGLDVLIGGQDDDSITIDSPVFRRIVGGTGTDKVLFNNPVPGVALSLDLTTLQDNRILGIEEFDISSATTVPNGNTLSLGYRDVLNISDEANTLIVRRSSRDTVNMGTGWTLNGAETIGNQAFAVYRQGNATLKLQTFASTVVNRQIFYNRSTSTTFGNGTGNPTNSIDSTRLALLPGQNSSPRNISNYKEGINGIIIDATIPSTSITIADLDFAVWDGITAGGFNPLAPSANPTLTVIAGGGVGGITRLKIEFQNASVVNTWLRVTLKANVRTNLASNDVFYFGSAVGDVYRQPGDVRVNSLDAANLRRSISSRPVDISNNFDVNKDGFVNNLDYFIVLKRMRAQRVLGNIRG